jgi:methionyl-tRNA formyltransferase
MRVIFMGSPMFAVPCLQAVAARHHVVQVVTQPDKPAGRGGQLTPPPVKVAALALGLPVMAPRTLRTPEAVAALAAFEAELAVVVAYGKILPLAVLRLFPRGCVNVHGSILPRYRGAAPVQRAVMAGEHETGVTIMMLDEGMDTGPTLLERRVAIGDDETAGQMLERLAPIGAAALLLALNAIAAGTATPVAQDHARATHAAMLDKRDGGVDFRRPARLVSAWMRGVDPWPGAHAVLRGQATKLFGPKVAGEGDPATTAAPGTVLELSGLGARVACGEGSVWIAELQVPGRKRLTAAQVAAGRGIAVGDQFTSAATDVP